MKYVLREHIDVAKWDDCIKSSPNGLVYAYSFYLDHMSKHWDALVYGDYEAVMPLTWNRKCGIKYLYQPPFTQQLGIFGKNSSNKELVELFISHLHRHFKFAEIFFNYGNYHRIFQSRPNYILPLNNNYDRIREGYKNVLEKNLKRASHTGLNYKPMDDPKMIIGLYKTVYGRRFSHVTNTDYIQFEKNCSYLQKKDALILRGAYNEDNAPQACVLLLRNKNRMHLVQSVTLPLTKTLQPNHFLLDNLIKEFSGGDLILDFEGSSIKGVAEFYQTFGAVQEPYFFYRYNELPWPLRMFK